MSVSITGFDYFKEQVQPELRAVVDYFFTATFNLYQVDVKQIPSRLVQAARQFTEEKEKTLYITALEQVQNAQAQMLNTFAFHLLESMQYFSGENIAQINSAQVEHNFNALETHAREDELLLRSLTSQLAERNKVTLDSLHQSLEQALDIRIEPLLSPFNTMFICHALHASLCLQGVHSRVKKEILHVFAESFFVSLDGLYANMLAQFQQLGFSGHSSSGVNADGPTSDTFDMDFNEILLSGVIPADFSGAAYIPLQTMTDNVLSQKELLALLASLQKGYDPITDGLLITHIKHRLSVDALSGKIAAPSLRDENVINLLGLTFQKLAYTVDEQTADLLLRLSVPFTRVLLCDELLLHDKSHPARAFLNALIELAHSNPDDVLVFKQVQLYVTKTLMRYQGDTQLFVDLSREVEALLEKYQSTAPQSLDDIAAQLRAEEKQQLVRKAIASFVHRLSDKINHKLRFYLLLDIFLQEIFFSIYTDAGKDSIEWQNALRFVQRLVSLLDNSDSDAFNAAKKELAATVKTLNRYLNDLGISMLWRRNFFDQMQEIQILLNRGIQLSELKDEQLKHTHAVDIIIDHYESEWAAQKVDSYTIGHQHTQAKPIGPVANSRIAAETLVDNLHSGQWINIRLNDKRTPCFLSHISQSRGVYIFYNRQHQKLFERQRNDLIEDFLTGSAFLIERSASFDAALHSLIQQLKTRQLL